MQHDLDLASVLGEPDTIEIVADDEGVHFRVPVISLFRKQVKDRGNGPRVFAKTIKFTEAEQNRVDAVMMRSVTNGDCPSYAQGIRNLIFMGLDMLDLYEKNVAMRDTAVHANSRMERLAEEQLWEERAVETARDRLKACLVSDNLEVYMETMAHAKSLLAGCRYQPEIDKLRNAMNQTQSAWERR